MLKDLLSRDRVYSNAGTLLNTWISLYQEYLFVVQGFEHSRIDATPNSAVISKVRFHFEHAPAHLRSRVSWRVKPRVKTKPRLPDTKTADCLSNNVWMRTKQWRLFLVGRLAIRRSSEYGQQIKRIQ